MIGQDRIQFIQKITSGLDQYQFTYSYKKKTELDNVYSLAFRISQYRKECLRYDIYDIFEILPFLDDDELATNAQPRNLFDNYKDISLNQVRRSTRMYYELGSEDYIVENLVWSGEKLLNSCDEELRDLILMKALFLPQKEVGGPVYFKIMMDIYNEINCKSPPTSPRSPSTMSLS